MKLKEFFRKSDLLCEKGDVDPNGKNFYLFYKLARLVPASWTDKDGNTIPMTFFGSNILLGGWKKFEREYFHNYSGNKETSVICDEIFEDNKFKDDTSDTWYKLYISTLADDIATKYMENWCRLWYAVNEKYRPLDNVDADEKAIPSANYSRDIINDSWSKDKQGKAESTSTDDVYAFNSATKVPSSEKTTVTDPKNDVTVPNYMAGGGTANSVNEGSSHHKETQTGYIQNLRHGNIGVTKSQDLLASEFEFRKNYNFYKHIFDDIDEVLTCKTYGDE